MDRSDTLVLRTPEGITFSLQLAGPASRALAWIVDLAVMGAISTVIGTVLGALKLLNEGTAAAFSILSYFVISIGYGIACEWLLRGQTVGKRLMRVRVMDAEGLHLHVTQVIVRNLLRAIDSLPLLYLVGGVSCLFTERAQRLGDLAANTIVIHQPRADQPDVTRWLGERYNSLLAYRHLSARLRQRVSPAVAGVALESLMRRDQFDPQARLTLFADLANHFRAAVEFPAEVTEQLSDEQYVRNVVEVLYRRS